MIPNVQASTLNSSTKQQVDPPIPIPQFGSSFLPASSSSSSQPTKMLVTLVSPTLGMSSFDTSSTNEHQVAAERNHHHHGRCTTHQETSTSTTGTTMTTYIPPLTATVVVQHPANCVSMNVHYLSDPYNGSNDTSSTQLRPYFLLRRPLLIQGSGRSNQDIEMQMENNNNNNNNAPSTTRTDTTTTTITITPQYEEDYQLCEMTLIDDMKNSSKSTNARNEDNTVYQSFLITNHSNTNNHNDTLSSIQLSSSPSHVVEDGSLYVMTPIDPLFWLLRDSYLPPITTMSSSSSSTLMSMMVEDTVEQLPIPTPIPKQQWQPVLQFLQEYDPVIQKCVYGSQQPQSQPQQYKHVLNVMSLGNHSMNNNDDGNDDDDDTMILVQFSIEKALLWLHQKQRKMEQYLLQSSSSQQQHQNNTNMNSNSNNSNVGAFTSGFTIAKENTTTTGMSTNTKAEDNNESKQQEQQRQEQQFRNRMKEESIQLICNYLSPAWQDHFVQYLKIHDPEFALLQQMTNEQQEPNTTTSINQNKRSKTSEIDMDMKMTTPTVDWNTSFTTNTNDMSTTAAVTSSKKKLLLLQPITAGAKRLLKVNYGYENDKEYVIHDQHE